jgi:hypothetical protein
MHAYLKFLWFSLSIALFRYSLATSMSAVRLDADPLLAIVDCMTD